MLKSKLNDSWTESMKIRKVLFSVCFSLAFTMIGADAAGNTIRVGSEIAYVQNDRDIYIAGESIFFKLYLVDAGSHKLSGISKIAYLVLRNAASTSIAQIKLKVEDGMAYGSIYLPDSLKSGVYQVCAFSNWMRNAGEESFFTKEIFIANRFDRDLDEINSYTSSIKSISDTLRNRDGQKPVQLATDKTEYGKRELIKLSLKFSPEISADSAVLSITVSEDVPGLNDYFTIGNYLQMNALELAGNQMVAHSNYRFLPEHNGEIVQGKVIDHDSKADVGGLNVFLSAADTLVNLQYGVTDSAGVFRFQLTDYYYGKDLYFSIKDIPEGKRLEIITEDKFELKTRFNPSQNQENPFLKDYILKSQDIVTVQKIYETTVAWKESNPFKPDISGPWLYYKPSYRIYPADFVPLNDFVEMSKEIIPPQLNLRKRNNQYTASMADENLHLYMDQEPAIFLDGVMINDVNPFIELGSDKVERVELVCSRYNCGDLVFPGILAVFSKNFEIRNIRPNASTLRWQPGTFHPYSNYVSQNYAYENTVNRPDFRQLLFCNPAISISTGHSITTEFYASDHSGNYSIRVEGITSGGVAVSAGTRVTIR